ncbi:response regulator transcription factor [Streptomyces sp. CA-111067]|uniref:response regulator transcription factor n=1 Tax=Streptomyces sp. CA-111067 TaxID=3240046 RepID=UPI003D9790A6
MPEAHQRDNADALSVVRSETGPLLSDRETAVLVLLADGLRIAGIAERLDLAQSTVRGSLQRIRDKVGGTGQHAMLDRAYRGGHLPAPTAHTPAPGTQLGPEQQAVLLLMAAGATAAEIASDLDISPSTAEARIAGIRSALGADTTAHALHLGWERGYLHPGQAPPARAGAAPRTTTAGTGPGGPPAIAPATGLPTANGRAAEVPALTGR